MCKREPINKSGCSKDDSGITSNMKHIATRLGIDVPQPHNTDEVYPDLTTWVNSEN